MAISISVSGKIDAALAATAVKLALGRTWAHAQVSVACLEARAMRALNKRTLNHDYAADVLSFDHGDSPEGRVLEIAVCPDVAKREAQSRNIPASQELVRYLVHGALHLCGYDDRNDSARKKMWRRQEQVMKKLFGKKYAVGIE